MATIKIYRQTAYNNRFRDFQVYLDGKKIGVIANNETKEFEVPPGLHTLSFKIDWGSSPTLSFEMADNETKTFKVAGFRYAKWLIPAGAIIATLHFIIQLLTGFPYTVYFAVPIFLLLLYYISFGRKNYLTVSRME